MKKLICLLVLATMVSGCATTYHRQTWTGGYSDTKIQDDIFRVEFAGNAYVSRGKVEDFALLRCAEVTLENGYKYFVILDAKSETQTGAYTTPATAHTYGTVYGTDYGGGYGGSYSGTTYVTGGQTYMFSKPSSSNMIKCFKERPENIPTLVFDAEQIKDNLKKQYKLDKEHKRKLEETDKNN